ncbi:MAG: hypothetical protein JWN04_3868 [Myxococcaceae bacterium]|nr:hypothetical protein [Myxococcaceae bacterium]
MVWLAQGRAPLVHALIVAGLLAVFSTARAQAPGEAVTVVDPMDIPPEHDPLSHAWDIPGQRGGFYLRASTSLGGNTTRLGPPSFESDANRTVSGFGTGYGLDLGGFIRPWVALHLDATVGVLWNGSIHHDGLAVEGRNNGNARVLAYGLAPAVTFFTAHNFFFKPAFGVGLATIKEANRSKTTNPGFYMHLVAGKDLYTGQNFSFGLQLEVAYMRLGADQKQEEARVRQFLFGVSFGFNSI